MEVKASRRALGLAVVSAASADSLGFGSTRLVPWASRWVSGSLFIEALTASPGVLAAVLPEHPAARVVPRVQPEVGGPGHGGGLPSSLRGRVPRGPAPCHQHGRRQRQHGPALQRVTLQLRDRQAAPGRGYVAVGSSLPGCLVSASILCHPANPPPHCSSSWRGRERLAPRGRCGVETKQGDRLQIRVERRFG